MKIKNIDNKLYKNYPTENEITNKNLKNNIPSKRKKMYLYLLFLFIF